MSTYQVTAAAGTTGTDTLKVGGLTEVEARQLAAVLHLDTDATITVTRECQHPAMLLPLALLFLLAGVTLIFGPGAFGESLSYAVGLTVQWFAELLREIWHGVIGTWTFATQL